MHAVINTLITLLNVNLLFSSMGSVFFVWSPVMMDTILAFTCVIVSLSLRYFIACMFQCSCFEPESSSGNLVVKFAVCVCLWSVNLNLVDNIAHLFGAYVCVDSRRSPMSVQSVSPQKEIVTVIEIATIPVCSRNTHSTCWSTLPDGMLSR